MEACVFVCLPLRPLCPCHPENPRKIRNKQHAKGTVQCVEDRLVSFFATNVFCWSAACCPHSVALLQFEETWGGSWGCRGEVLRHDPVAEERTIPS